VATPKGTLLQTVEIKSGQTVTPDTIRAGRRSAAFAGEEALEPWLVHGGEEQYQRSGVNVISWRGVPAVASSRGGDGQNAG